MKHPLETEDVYVLANRHFPDGVDLATFNLIYEIRNGLLVPLDPDAIPDGEAELVCMIGYVDLGDQFWIMRTLGEPDDAAALKRKMEDRVLELPHATDDEDAEAMTIISREFPTTIAAMVAWRTPDGTTSFVVYRHPDIPAHRARATLKDVIAEVSAQSVGAGVPVGDGKN
ncbi:MAG: hypothetical protein AAB554_00700 [Patescibacteria group bacterium]